MSRYRTNPDDAAFPMQYSNNEWQSGLTIRAYLAGKALQGLLANEPIVHALSRKDICYNAVRYADALIEELNKEPEENNEP